MPKLVNGIVGITLSVFFQTLFIALVHVTPVERLCLIYATTILIGTVAGDCSLWGTAEAPRVPSFLAFANLSVITAVFTRSPGLWILGSLSAGILFGSVILLADGLCEHMVPPPPTVRHAPPSIGVAASDVDREVELVSPSQVV